MKCKLAVLLLALAAQLPAAYQYFYTDYLTSIDPVYGPWQVNGSVSPTSAGLSAPSANGGSLIWRTVIPDPAMYYEVQMTIHLAQSGGTYVAYLSASLDALSGPSPQGTYAAVEVQNPTFTGGQCSANLVVSQRVNGIVTVLSSSVIACRDGMKVRAVWRNGPIRVTVDEGFFSAWVDSAVGTVGRPGVGARETTGLNHVRLVELGPADLTAPNAPAASSILSSLTGHCVYLHWLPASDDANGRGVVGYGVWRGATYVGDTWSPEITDCGVTLGQTYTYSVKTIDLWANFSSASQVTVTAGSAPGPGPAHVFPPDPVRFGVRPLASYWGAGPEQIDTRSGNLNFNVPLIRALGRGGWGVNFALTYNSQLWFMEGSAQTKLGQDVGYGFGWKLLAGALTPIWSGSQISYYLYTDSTGAEYKLDVQSDGVWRSREGTYVFYDASADRLYFPDGSFWQMGAVTSSGEPDAGTRYPTLMQDSNGNRVRVYYQHGSGVTWPDSSARISEIEDVRAILPGGYNSYRTYTFAYNTDAIPHLTSITNHIGTSESYTFGYLTGQSLTSPFSPPQSFGTVSLLSGVTITALGAGFGFEYSGGAGEMSRSIFPYGGAMRYAYRTAAYSSSRSTREVQTRWFQKASGAAETSVSFEHDDAGDTTRPFHAWSRLVEDIATFQNVWTFSLTTGASYGLATRFDENTGTTGITLRRRDFTWTQDSVGTVYIGTVLTTLDVSARTQKQSKTEQTLDRWGNVTETRLYDYTSLTTPARTYVHSYLTGAEYEGRWIRNRPTSTTVNGTQVESTTYDSYGTLQCWGRAPVLVPANRTEFAANNPRQHDLMGHGAGFRWRGNPTVRTVSGVTTCLSYDSTGSLYEAVDSLGSLVAYDITTATNYAAPSRVSPNAETALSTSATYTTFLGIASVTAPNSANTWATYDALGRPQEVKSPHDQSAGAQYKTVYTYTVSPPTETATTAGRWTRKTMDGLGRTIKQEAGDGTGTKSIVDTEYDRCPCSPLGKVKRVSQPYAPGGTIYWTTYTYDSLGRTISVTLPDGTGTTTYQYGGNQVLVTGPSGRWKRTVSATPTAS